METELIQHLPPFPIIIASCFIVFTTILFFMLLQKNRQIKRIRCKVYDKKHEAYDEVLNLFFEMFWNGKNLNELNVRDSHDRILEAKKLLFLYSTDDILFKYFEWYEEAKKPNNASHLAKYIDLIILIRKDMGQEGTLLTREHVLRSICASDETYNEIQQSILS
jgi:hypothetical protein